MGNERGGGDETADGFTYDCNGMTSYIKKNYCSEYTVSGGREHECFSLRACVFFFSQMATAATSGRERDGVFFRWSGGDYLSPFVCLCVGSDRLDCGLVVDVDAVVYPPKP